MPVTKAIPRIRNATYRSITPIPLSGRPATHLLTKQATGFRDRYHGIGGMGTIKRSPEVPPEASGCWSCALGAFHAQRRAAAHLQPIPADTAVKHFSGPSPPLPRAAAERHAATWRQVSRSRHSPGKCPMSSRTSASVFRVMTDGILRGRGNGRDQFGRDNSVTPHATQCAVEAAR
jgi:hypothetical protein